jgi:hypothetical protein
MEKQKSDQGRGPNKGMIKPGLLIAAAVASAALLMRKKKKPVTELVKQRPVEWVPFLPGTQPHESDTFFQLRMSWKQYETIKQYPGSTLVFQFYYPRDSVNGSPTLYVYNMKKLHQSIKGALPEVLSYWKVSNEKLRGRDQVLGDLQMKISDLDQLIKDVTANKGGKFDNLFFSPIYRQENPHIAYLVSVDGTGSARCDPSPPATAM